MASAYEGGIGGKIRRRPLRKPPTPYDRPPTAPVNPTANTWISKIVDPASKIITGSATRLFSSVFRVRLTAPPTPSSTPETETHSETRNERLGEYPSGSPEHENVEGENNSQNIGSSGISELEQLLKQKTFTRAEFDRLTELLRSRTVDSLLDGNKSAEPGSSKPVSTQARDERTVETISEWENGLESCRVFESVPGRAGPDGGLPVCEEEPPSPAELAKAYMGTRPSKVSQSALGLRSQMLRKDSSFLKTLPSGPKSSDLLLAPASRRRVAAFSESNYLTPRTQGRSAIYSMVRTPYTRVHSRLIHHSTQSMNDGSTRFLASHLDQVSNSPSDKQALKRTSSVLDDGFGSVGPIRRIRQKPNLISPLSDVKSLPRRSLRIPETPASLNTVQGTMLSGKKPLPMDGRKDGIMKQLADENGHDKLSTVNSPFAPTQSGEMAKKIFQQLDKLAPSPKEKLLETRVFPSKEKSATELIYGTSNGKASKSTESTKSPRLQNLQVSGTSNGLSGNQLFPAIENSISGKQDKAEVNGPIKITDPGRKPSSDVDGRVNIANSDKGSKSAGRPVGSILFDFAANQSGKRQAPPVNAPKDALVLEDDKDAGKSILSASCASENKIVAIETIMEKPVIASAKPSEGFIFSMKDASFASTSAADTMKQSSSVVNKPVSAEDGRATLVFNFDTRNTKQNPVFAFSSNNSSSREVSETIFNNRKSEVPNSNASGDAYPEDTGLEKRKRNQKETELETAKSMSISATSKPFSFGLNNNSMVSTISNGSLLKTSLLSSASTPTTPTFGASRISSSSSASTSASSSISSISQAPLVCSFGASSPTADTSTHLALSPTSNLSEGSRELESKKKQAPVTFCTTVSSSPATFASRSDASVSCSSTTISFSDSNLPKSSTPFGATSGSLFSNASGVAQSTQSMLSQSGSSASSPAFGLSDSASSGSASSLFGSSSSSKLFGSDSGFGGPSSFAPSSASTTFSLVASSFAASSSSTKSISSSSSQTSTPSIFSSKNGVPSSAAGFSFGAAGATSSGPVVSFGACPAASYATGVSFGASSAAASTSSGFSLRALSAPAPASSATGFSFVTPATAGSSGTGISFGAPATAATSATASSPTVFSFQASASAAASSTTEFSFPTSASSAGTTQSTFQSSQGTPSGGPFSFPSAASSSLSATQIPFGATNPVNFSSSSGGNDNMNVEDSMAEDTTQASIPASPAFGQAALSPSPVFNFGSPVIASSGPSVFPFGSEQSTTGSLPGGGFSLGTSDDKSKRKIIKIRRDSKLRKK